MNYNKLIIPLEPSINQYHQPTWKKNGNRGFAQFRLTKEANAFIKKVTPIIEKWVEDTWLIIKPLKWPNKLIVEITAYLPRSSADSSNRHKMTIDCLAKTGIIEDDNQVILRYKDSFVDTKNPRMELEIYPKLNHGVFKDENSFRLFLYRNCNDCTRGSRCVIMKDLLDNRVNENVGYNFYKCSKFKVKK